MAIDNGNSKMLPRSLDARVARLEATMEHVLTTLTEMKANMRSDFRFLVGMQLTTTLALVGVMAKGFGWL
jgi:hypothetical protein